MKTLIALLLTTIALHAEPLERCSYDTERDGKLSHTIEAPTAADGSNQKRFSEIEKMEADGVEGWRGYKTINVECRPLDNEARQFTLFVQTENGTVGLIHSLTEYECYSALYASDPHRYAPSGSSWLVQGNDFKQGQCFK